MSRRSLALGCLTLVVLFAQFPIVFLEIQGDRLFNYRVQLLLSDLPLAALVGLAMPDVRALAGERRGLAALWGILTLILAIALVAHPSALALQTVLRVLGTLAIIVVMRGLPRDERRLIALALGVAAATQFVWGLLQIARGTPLGVPALGEFADPLFERGGLVTPRGTLGHGYMLSALGVLAACLGLAGVGPRARRLAIGAAALLGAPVGLTFSRAALGAAVLVAVSLAAAARHPRQRLALVVFVGAIAAGTAWRADGWLDRADQTFGPPRDDGAMSREALSGQATTIIASSALLGVGPGQYLRIARTSAGADAEPVHDVPLLAAAEGGVAAGLAAAGIALLLVVRALRGPTEQRIVALALLPFFVLDQFLYTEAQGLVLTGLWLGTSDALSRDGAMRGARTLSTDRRG